MTIISATVSDYFEESHVLIDSYFFERLVGMVLAHLAEQYAARLLGVYKVRRWAFEGILGCSARSRGSASLLYLYHSCHTRRVAKTVASAPSSSSQSPA